jgi:hypothetical protein
MIAAAAHAPWLPSHMRRRRSAASGSGAFRRIGREPHTNRIGNGGIWIDPVARRNRRYVERASLVRLVRNQRHRAMIASFTGGVGRDVLMVAGTRSRVASGAIHD